MPDLARRLHDALYADGPDTEWSADTLAAVGEVLADAEARGYHNADQHNARAYLLARTLFPADGEWSTDDLQDLADGLAYRAGVP